MTHHDQRSRTLRTTGVAARRRGDSIGQRVAADLDAQGCAVLERLLAPEECEAIAGALSARTRASAAGWCMARHGFGRGEYKYFAYPLPDLDRRRCATALYPQLAPSRQSLERGDGHRRALSATDTPTFLARCHEAGQTRPTPLLLQYGAGDYNCLHQDLYGEHVFPLQVAILLSEPGEDFTGGEFVLTEQRPRMQSRPRWCRCAGRRRRLRRPQPAGAGDARHLSRTNMRHGVSRLRSGHRHTVGIIFHDAT